ncbi:signal peptidase I [bacterium]|nr:signal peptidase I [bacterium]
MRQRKKSALREWIEVIFTAFILYLIIVTFIIQSFHIPSRSMEHTLKVGDRLFASKFSYGLSLPFTDKKVFKRQPKRGDIIVFRYPGDPYRRISLRLIAPVIRILTFKRIDPDPHKDYIKRLVGLPGELLEIREGKVYINDKPLNEPYVFHSIEDLSFNHYGPVTVPPDSYFMMGDNREHSSDSRFWGFLERKYLKGRALFIYWPPKRIGLIR